MLESEELKNEIAALKFELSKEHMLLLNESEKLTRLKADFVTMKEKYDAQLKRWVLDLRKRKVGEKSSNKKKTRERKKAKKQTNKQTNKNNAKHKTNKTKHRINS